MTNPYESNEYNNNNGSGDYKAQFDHYLNKTHEAVGRRLTRSTTDSMLAGVLGGIGQTYGINSSLLRVLFVLSFFLPGPQFLAYIAAWVIIPKR